MSAIPDARDYELGGSRHSGRPAFGLPNNSNDREIKRFDAKMHVRMNEATTREDWSGITDDLIKASGKPYDEVGGLRGKVKDHFLSDCPDPELRKRFNQALMPKKSNAVRLEIERERSLKRQQAEAKKKARADRDRKAYFDKIGNKKK